MNEAYVELLLNEWSDVHKKGQLTLWVLLAISDGRKYAAQINDFISSQTDGNFEVKEQSMYRALRRFNSMGIVNITEEESPNSGPKRKYYELTYEGDVLLARFVRQNIKPLLQPHIITLLNEAEKKGQKT